VAARLDANAATRVRLNRSCPHPSIEPASSELVESLRSVLSLTGDESRSELSCGRVELAAVSTVISFRLCDGDGDGAAGSADCAFGNVGRCTFLVAVGGFFVIQIGSRFFATTRLLSGVGAFGLASRPSVVTASGSPGVGMSDLDSAGFLTSSRGMAVSGGVNGSGSSSTDLNLMPKSGLASSLPPSSGIVSCLVVSIVSNSLRDGGLVGVPNLAGPSAGVPSALASGVSGVALTLDKSTPKSECLRTLGL
jgi:hypothetical protein